jgi:hypothetical protein
MSVGTNEANNALPLVRVESPREMNAIVDVRREAMSSAARFYGTTHREADPLKSPCTCRTSTVWAAREGCWPNGTRLIATTTSWRCAGRDAPQPPHLGRLGGRVADERHHPSG